MVNNNIKRCKHCGTSLIQLQTTHRVGCSLCYESFRNEIKTIVGDTVSLSTHNEGLKNFRIQLKLRLDKALAHEEYELAARLRDELSETGSHEFSAEE